MLFTEGLQIAFVGDNGTAIVKCMEGAGLPNINITRVPWAFFIVEHGDQAL